MIDLPPVEPFVGGGDVITLENIPSNFRSDSYQSSGGQFPDYLIMNVFSLLKAFLKHILSVGRVPLFIVSGFVGLVEIFKLRSIRDVLTNTV